METDLYEVDAELRGLIDWICVSEQMKENNNKIRILTGEKQINLGRRGGVREKLERMKNYVRSVTVCMKSRMN